MAIHKEFEHKATLAIKKFSFGSRFGLTLIPKHRIPKIIAALCLIIWKSQTLALSVLFACQYLEAPEFSLIIVARKVAEGFIFGPLFDFKSANGFDLPSFLFFQFYTWISIGLAVLQAFEAFNYEIYWKKAQNYWSRICYVHSYIFSFPIFAFHVGLLKASGDGSGIIFGMKDGAGKSFVIALSVITIIWNLVLSTMILFVFPIPLKTKDPLSTKSRKTEGIEMAQKMGLIMVYLFLAEGSGKVWLLILANMGFVFFRLYVTYGLLPYYKLIWQKLDTGFIACNGLLCVLNFIGWGLKDRITGFPQRFLIATWVLLIPVCVKINNEIVKNVLSKMLETYEGVTPYKLLHLIPLFKSIMDQRNPTRNSTNRFKIEELFFLGKSRSIKMKDLDVNTFVNFDFDDPMHFRNYTKSFLLDCIERHPDFHPLKVSYIQYRLNIDKTYLEAAYLVDELKKLQPSVGIETCLLMLRIRMESELYKKIKEFSGQNLDMKRYFELNEEYHVLKEKMTEQVTTQVKFWKLFNLPEINTHQMREISCQVENQKAELERIWKKVESFNEKNYTLPYLLYAMYLEVVNNTPSVSSKFRRQHYGTIVRFETEDNMDQFNEENLFHKDNIQIEVSGRKEDLGYVVSCSPNTFELLDQLKEDVVGKDVIQIMPQFFKKIHSGALNRFFENGKETILDRTRKVFATNQKGLIFPILLHVKQNPSFEKSISFMALVRKLKDNNEYMIIHGDGKIDGMTQRLARILQYSPDEYLANIHDFCRNFKDVNEAFNVSATNIIKKKIRAANLAFLEFKEIEEEKEKEKPLSPDLKTLKVSIHKNPQGKDFHKTVTLKEPEENLKAEESGTETPVKIGASDSSALLLRKRTTSNTRKSSMDPENLMFAMRKKQLALSGTSSEKKKLQLFTKKKTATKGDGLWSRFQFLSGLNPEELAKTTRQFKEGGGELTMFRRGSVLDPIKCTVKIETEIYDSQWIHVLSFIDIQRSGHDSEEDLNQAESASTPVVEPKKGDMTTTSKRVKTLGKQLIGSIEPIVARNTQGMMAKETGGSFGGSMLKNLFTGFGSKKIGLQKMDTDGNSLASPVIIGTKHGDESPKGIAHKSSSPLTSPYHKKSEGLHKGVTIASDFIHPEDDDVPQDFEQHFPTESEGNDNVQIGDYVFSKKKFPTVDKTILKRDTTETPKADRTPRTPKKVTEIQLDKKKTDDAKAKKKLNELLANIKDDGIIDTSSVSSSVSGKYRINKLIEEAIDHTYYQKKTLWFMYSFIFMLLMVQSLILGIGIYVISSQSTIKSQTQIMEMVYNRTDFIVQADFFVRQLDLIYDGSTAGGVSAFNAYIQDLDGIAESFFTNSVDLSNAVSGASASIQDEFFKKLITMYDMDITGPTGTSTLNEGFEAVSKLYAIILRVTKEAAIGNVAINLDMDFLLYNSLNDVILRCQQIADYVQKQLTTNLDKNKAVIYSLSAVGVVILGIFALVSFWILREMIASIALFSNFYTKVPDEDIKASQQIVESFLESLNEDHVQDELAEFAKMKNVENKQSKLLKKLKMSDSKRESACLMAKLWPSLVIVAGMLLTCFIVTLIGLRNLDSYQNRISQAARDLYIADLQNTALLELIATDGGTTIQGLPTETEIPIILAQTSQMTQFLNYYKNSDGSVDNKFKGLLLNITCESIPIANINAECTRLSGGNDFMGIVDLFTKYYQQSEAFFDDYLLSTQLPSDIATFAARHESDIYDTNIVLNYLLRQLWDVSNQNFLDNLASQKTEIIVVMIITSILALLLAAITVPFVLFEIVKQDDKMKKILKIAPLGLVMKNRWIKSYLIQSSGKLGDTLKRAI